MGQNNNFKHPQFTTASGITLDLAPVGGVKIGAFRVNYGKVHPAPRPKPYKAENGEWFDDLYSDEYKSAMSAYEERQNMAMNAYILAVGVKTSPPKNWVTEFPLHDNLKLAWLLEILEDADYSELLESLVSLSNATQKAVEDAEKN